MKCLVTGAAGFIGSHLSERLLKAGYQVIGIDCFTDYYSRKIKEDNLSLALQNKNYKFIEADLLDLNLDEILPDTNYVFHQAAQAGVRTSWGKNFDIYTRNNILSTQRLLEYAKNYPVSKFIYASSSSIYGEVNKFPMQESDLPQPLSPYGVTKLAAEHLCQLYYNNFQLPTVSLRYFTVYGPRQRPDMAFHRFIRAILLGEVISIYGNGEQIRDFTFFADAVEANYQAALRGTPGAIYNLGRGSEVTVNQVLFLLEKIIGQKAKIKYLAKCDGDVSHTAADISKAAAELNYHPSLDIEDGLKEEVIWIREKLAQRIIN